MLRGGPATPRTKVELGNPEAARLIDRVQAYTVIGVLKDALERAASTDRDRLREALAKTNLADHILPQDAIRLDDTGENVNASPALLQVQGGRPVVVGPARFAEARPVFPVARWHG
jgi:branched-chain amino acid transport system substrate-binding protein